MTCRACGGDLRDGARVCLACGWVDDPTPEERARAVRAAVDRDRIVLRGMRIRPVKVTDSVEGAYRGLFRWTVIAMLAVGVTYLYFAGGW
jgi:hypothetical protein